MSTPDIPYPPSAHPGERVVENYTDLARWLGGDETSWTGDFLRLVAKSDPQHREALRRAAPRAVAAWEAWYAQHPVTGDQLAAILILDDDKTGYGDGGTWDGEGVF
jgi:hypothetical protein